MDGLDKDTPIPACIFNKTCYIWTGVNSLLNKSCWEDNIKIGIQEVGFEFLDWIALAQDRDRWQVPVRTVMNLWFPQSEGSFFCSWVHVSYSERTLLLVMWVFILQNFCFQQSTLVVSACVKMIKGSLFFWWWWLRIFSHLKSVAV